MLRPNLSTSWMWNGTLPGTTAANDPSACTGTSPYFDWPSNSVVPNMSTPPSSPENPSISRTLTTLPGVRFALMSPSDES